MLRGKSKAKKSKLGDRDRALPSLNVLSSTLVGLVACLTVTVVILALKSKESRAICARIRKAASQLAERDENETVPLLGVVPSAKAHPLVC